MQEPRRGVWGYSPPENFKSGSIETLFSVLVMSYVSEKSASNMKMANHYDQNN